MALHQTGRIRLGICVMQSCKKPYKTVLGQAHPWFIDPSDTSVRPELIPVNSVAGMR
jgi:hypothetical protein